MNPFREYQQITQQPHATPVIAAGTALVSLISLSVTVALALRIRRLRAERDRAVTRAREDLARDVHDLVGHWLWLASLKSELAYRRTAGDSRLHGELGEVLQAVRHAAHAVRQASKGDRRPSLGDESARARALLTGFGAECSISAASAGLPEEVSAVLGTVVREGVTNMLRHSTVGRCVIELTEDGDRLRLTVANDGAPGPERPWSAGCGLGNLRHRVAGLGGTVRATAGEDGWFRLVAEVPRSFSE
ncbi:histidine kinase [Streptosporangium sp. NPDC006007]|uniref:sensor histidine kinase n=1 Tax=Streptosporangium sp. NPDC006007 TaxID=3154575 RepID=UPI0033A7F9A8